MLDSPRFGLVGEGSREGYQEVPGSIWGDALAGPPRSWARHSSVSDPATHRTRSASAMS
jgi:hypothetical protein